MINVVDDEYVAFDGSYDFGPCISGPIGDGECDQENNIEECGESNVPCDISKVTI